MLLSERDNEQLGLILHYIGKIAGYVEKFGSDLESFVLNDNYHDLCCFALVQLGEAAGRLSEDFTSRHREMDWRSIHGLRCYLVHGYENVNYKIVWETIEIDLPQLKRFCLERYEGE